MIPIELLPGARAELVLASEWFEDQENGLGAQFLASAGHTIDAIQAHPERFARVNAPRRVRRAILKRFPYAVYYTFNGSRIFILSAPITVCTERMSVNGGWIDTPTLE